MDTKWRSIASRTSLIACLLLIQACASTTIQHTARMQYFSGQPELALKTLDTINSDSRNRLLVQLDRGAIAFASGQYRESSRALLIASRQLDELDFVSLSEQSTALVSNDWATTYRGEYSERLWIHSLQMMNFLLLNEPYSAAVEARQAIELLRSNPDALNKDWFTRTLIGLSFEAVGQYDSAHIEYKKLAEDASFSQPIANLAWNNAKRLGRTTDANKIANGRNLEKYDSAIVLFVDSGRIPRKQIGSLSLDTDLYIGFPVYSAYDTPVSTINVSLNGTAINNTAITTHMIDVARAALAERGEKIAVKSIARAAAKDALAKKARSEDSVLGALVSAALFIMETPDIRSWETLPGQLSVIVIPVKPGTHTVSVEVNGALQDGSPNRVVTINDIAVKRGQRVYRTLHQATTSTPNQPVN